MRPLRPTYTRWLVLAAVILSALMPLQAGTGEASLDDLFRDPPLEMRPSGYWWWLYNNVDKASITRDLEEFRNKGLGAVLMVCSANWSASKLPQGPAFLSLEWKELYLHALKEAARLGLKVDLNIAPGWNMGGPWITPENACRWYLQSDLVVEGPASFQEKLPLPGVNDGYDDQQPQLGVYHQVRVPMEEADYRDTALVAFRVPEGADEAQLRTMREDLAAKSARQDGNCFIPPQKVMDMPRQPWQNEADDIVIPVDGVIDLSAKMDADGVLEWEVPEGRWVIVRTGHRKTGAKLSVPLPGQEGLENDFFDRAGVEQMFEHSGRKLAEWAGPLAGTTLRAFCSDSFEAGYPNWTAKLPEHFKHYRGYDMTPYLPVLRGYIVGSAEISQRFLHDYRKTLGDCMADEHYRRFAELAAEYGIEIRAEPAGPSWSGTVMLDGLKNLGRVHYPQGEFWLRTFVTDGQNRVSKQTASGAHIYGRRTVSAEAFTSQGSDSEGRSIHWSAYPEMLKPLADRAFCEGINHMVFHTLTSQRPQDGKPGYEYGAGTHFNPNVTWWEQAAGPWLDYINRCQALLQSGRFVADVLYYNGDWVPNLVSPERVRPDLGTGYDFDVCNEEVLLTRTRVEDGRIVLPDGMNYRVLVLPEASRMPVAVAQRIAELVRAGATVIGPRPEMDPGLLDYPRSDEVVRDIATELWGGPDADQVRRVGKGRVITGLTPREVLLADGVLPDFEADGEADAAIDFIHRQSAEADWYFVPNGNDRPEQVTLRFRQQGRQPELWDPLSGEQRPLPEWRQTNESTPRTELTWRFEPHGSAFFVFRRAPESVSGTNITSHRAMQQIDGPWTVQFNPAWFYPVDGLSGREAEGEFVFKSLDDWSQRPESAIRHFSGTARYHTEFELSAAPKHPDRVLLDLGHASVSARVRLNGTDLGVVWCEPWRVEVGEALQAGRNRLEIEVVNCWPNRLIGDGLLPEAERRTQTNIRVYDRLDRKGRERNAQRLPSGLHGPVRLVEVE